jgi:hypothetical protein
MHLTSMIHKHVYKVYSPGCVEKLNNQVFRSV